MSSEKKSSSAGWWDKFTPEEKRAKKREYYERNYAKNREKILAQKRAYKAANKPLIKERSTKYREANLEKLRVIGRRYAAANKERMNKQAREYAKSHPEVGVRSKKKWREKPENLEKGRAYSRLWYANHKEDARIKSIKWRSDNKVKLAALQAKHRARVLRATPGWANGFFMEEAYDLAARRSKLFGFKWNVDHIVPLNSRRVCGLHCEQNFRVIPGIENVRKGNRHWPDMP